jgi:FkbM family methyltransferase
MNIFFQTLKRKVELHFGCRIYRGTLPRGIDLHKDMSAVLGPEQVNCIIDVGANVGLSISEYLSGFPKGTVYGIEPCLENYELIEKKFAGCQRVLLRRMAMSDRDCEVILHLKENNQTHSLIETAGLTVGQQFVKGMTLDSFCAFENINQVNFCKIDTEGHDLAVLRGAKGLMKKQSIDFIQVETSVRRDINYFSGFHDIDRHMDGLEYELFGIYEQQKCWTGRNSLLYFNAVYIRSSLVDGVAPME